MMRVLLTLALAGQCAPTGRDAAPPPAVTGVSVDPGTSTGEPDADLPRLDLGAAEPWTTGGATTGGSTGGSTGDEPKAPTTGEPATSTDAATSTGPGSTGPAEGSTGGSTSTGEAPGTSTGGEESTGDPLTDCPCEPGADNVCDLAPGTCSATSPGGICDPNGDGAFFDGDWTLGFQLYQEKCG